MSLQTKLQGLIDGKTAVVNSINAKAETSLTVNSKWSDLASAVDGITTGGGGTDVEPIVLTGDCTYACSGAIAQSFLTNYPTKVSTNDIDTAEYMFRNASTLTRIPFDINMDNSVTPNSFKSSTRGIFEGCSQLTEVPRILNYKVGVMSNLFNGCYMLREIPEDFTDTWDWSYVESTTLSTYTQSTMFSGCYSLRKVPYCLISTGSKANSYSGNYLYLAFSSCYALDEIINLPLFTTATWTSNTFSSTFSNCSRVKNITFALNPETNQPYAMKWKSQTIDLSSNVGYVSQDKYVLNYNSGITADKKVTDDATYQALKNDPDWFTTNWLYSRYNHDSAVATINSLPDTSAYLATAGGTNIIKFKGTAGANTDGGAINTLTPEEIAVATAKGWTVTIV